MADVNGECPTVLGADARFKGELSFDKGVRIEGHFEGQINSKGTLHVAEGAKITADIQAANVRIEGECKGNLTVSEKLHLLATARMEGDLRTNRLEIADGAIFIGKVVVGQAASEAHPRRPSPGASTVGGAPTPAGRESTLPGQPPLAPGTPPRTRPQDMRVPSGS